MSIGSRRQADWLLLAALVAGISYLGSPALVLPDWAAIAWKGSGVALLAIWAAGQGRTTDHRLLVTVLALGATADMVLELNFVAGAAIFAVGHVVAIVLYLRNRGRTFGWFPVACLPLILGVVLTVLYVVPDGWRMPVAVYALFLVAMLVSAALSRFRLAAVGASLFVLSDTLIFWRMGYLQGFAWADTAIWASYFAGQALIAWGVKSDLTDAA